MEDKIVETKKCINCWIVFTLLQWDIDMLDRLSPIIWNKKYAFPLPTLCPKCSLQKKLSFRLDNKLYRRTCDFSGKDIISVYSPDKPFKIYDQNIRQSDQWDPLEYGITYDPTQPFFHQFALLLQKVPRFAVMNEFSEKSEYCHHSSHLKNCYLIFASANDQDCYYGYRVIDSENVYDSIFVTNSKNIYESVNIDNWYSLFFCQGCKDCSYSRYLYNCEGCHNCLWCVNLNNASYCIYNKEYTKEEYQKIFDQEIKKFDRKRLYEFSLPFPRKYGDIIHSENVIGDIIYRSKNVFMGFNVNDSENIRYSRDMYNHMTNCMSCFSWYGPVDRSYESIATGDGWYNVYFSYSCYPSTDACHCFYCYGCSNIFGCIGLRNKSYCIFNKQYTETEYTALVPQIIEKMIGDWEWWEFCPATMSDFGYNETVGQEYFPLKREEAVDQWFNRSDYEAPIPKVEKTLQANQLPDDIQQVSDDILNQAIICEISWKPFRIIKQELEFYRKNKLQLPHKHPDVRHKERMAMRQPRQLRERKCAKCWVDIKTSYSPERPEIVYCEQCYNKEVYW